MSEAPGPKPPEQPKQEASPLKPTEVAPPPLAEVVATPDASAEAASLAQLQALRVQYDSILPKARAYIDWGPRLPGRAQTARDKVAVYGRDGETAETISLKVQVQTLDRAFQVTREISKRVDNGEQSVMQIDYVLAHPSEAQAMDVSGLIQSLSARIIALERFMNELQKYESIIGSPPTPEAPSVAPAAQSAEAPKPSSEASPHPEEMQRARALREEFRQLCAEIQKYMVEIRLVDARSTELSYPQGKALTQAETEELASARDLKDALKSVINSTTGFWVEQSAKEVDQFLETGKMTAQTQICMLDLQTRIDENAPLIQKFREHWAKYLPQRQFVRQEKQEADTRSPLEAVSTAAQAEAQALLPEVVDSIREVTGLTQELQKLTEETQRYVDGMGLVDARLRELRGIRGRALTVQESQELNSSNSVSRSLEVLRAALDNSGIRIALRSLKAFLDEPQINSQYALSLADIKYRIDLIKREIQQIREHWKNYLPQIQGNFSTVSPSNG